MKNEVKFFKIVINWFIALISLIVLLTPVYDIFVLNRFLDDQALLKINGEVEKQNSYNSFSTFMVKDTKFRTGWLAYPCLDIESEIHNGIKVSIQYKMIPKWPRSNQSYGCIIKVKFLSEKNIKRSGQSSRNT